MFTHPIAAEMEAWCKDHFGQHDDPAFQRYLSEFTSLLATKHGELLAEHSNDGRFGMSGAGGCTRKAGLKLLGHKPEPFSGSTLATFHIGHLVEVMTVSILRAMGYTIDGTQEPVRIDPFMHSYHDGVLTGGQFTAPVVLSVKSTGYKKSGQQRGKFIRQGFPALPFDGIRKSQPSWWVQAQAEMHGSGIPQALVVVVAKDMVKAMEADPYMQESGSLTFYAELIDLDDAWCELELLPVWSSAWKDVQAGFGPLPYVYNPQTDGYARLPRPGGQQWDDNREATGSYNVCNYCDLVLPCKAQAAADARARLRSA